MKYYALVRPTHQCLMQVPVIIVALQKETTRTNAKIVRSVSRKLPWKGLQQQFKFPRALIQRAMHKVSTVSLARMLQRWGSCSNVVNGSASYGTRRLFQRCPSPNLYCEGKVSYCACTKYQRVLLPLENVTSLPHLRHKRAEYLFHEKVLNRRFSWNIKIKNGEYIDFAFSRQFHQPLLVNYFLNLI